MKKLEISNFGLIHAGPSCGKTVLVSTLLNKGKKVIDPDTLIFGWFMSGETQARLKELGNPPWHAAGDQRLQWQIVTRAALAYANSLVIHHDYTVITNLSPDHTGSYKSVSFFRKPEGMAAIMQDRQKALGKDPSTDYLKVAKRWYEGWLKYNHLYDEAIELGEGEFLSDYFGETPDSVDAVINDRNVYDKTYQALRSLDLFSFIEPSKRVGDSKPQSASVKPANEQDQKLVTSDAKVDGGNTSSQNEKGERDE